MTNIVNFPKKEKMFQATTKAVGVKVITSLTYTLSPEARVIKMVDCAILIL